MVRLSGAVDEAGYLEHNPPQAERGAEPVDHFCRRGWRRLRNPSLDFDVWWYVAEYLDPADDSETAINPLVHYLVDGRFRGLLPLPEPTARPVTVLDGPPRRVCLFALYDPDGLVDDYVVDYVTELARFADVYVVADCELQPGQLARLDGVVRGSWAPRHGAHDFGSWSLLARELVGWEALEAYDEVLLANDSCWLLRPLDEVFARMDRQACDFWSLQVTARLFEPEPGEPQALPLDEVKRDRIPALGVPVPPVRPPGFLLPGAAPAGARRPRLPPPPRQRRPAAGPRRARAEVRVRHHPLPRRPGLRLLDLAPRPAPQPPALRPGRLRPARARASRCSSGGSWWPTRTSRPG